jgi:hypothetical protein
VRPRTAAWTRATLPALVAAVTAFWGDSAGAAPRFEPQHRGAVIEVIPQVSICVPTAIVSCNSDGSTRPFVGGTFNLGFRATRLIHIGLSYSGASLRPDYERELRPAYAEYGQLHGGWAVFRPNFDRGILELGMDIGAGYSWLNFPYADAPGVTSQGFSLKLAPIIAFFVHPHVYLGIRGDMILNFHGQVCVDTGVGGERCEERSESEQLPIHQFLGGLALGFVI